MRPTVVRPRRARHRAQTPARSRCSGLFHSSKNQPKDAATSSAPKLLPCRRVQAISPTARSDHPAINSTAARDDCSPANEKVSRRAIARESAPNAIPARKRVPIPTVRMLIRQSLRARPWASTAVQPVRVSAALQGEHAAEVVGALAWVLHCSSRCRAPAGQRRRTGCRRSRRWGEGRSCSRFGRRSRCRSG